MLHPVRTQEQVRKEENITCEEYSSSQSRSGMYLLAVGQTLVLGEVNLAWKARVIDEKEPVLALPARDLRQQGNSWPMLMVYEFGVVNNVCHFD